jgi:hypothetical protein
LKKKKKKGDRRGRKEGRNLELWFCWLSIAKNIFLKIKSGKLHMLLEIFNSHK